MELIWSQPGFKACNEPLNLRDKYKRNNSKIADFEELYSSNVINKLESYFNSIDEGHSNFLNPHLFSRYYRPFTNRIVYKVINGAEEYINEIAEVTNSRVVYLIRHPMAVSLSRKVLPRLNYLCGEDTLNELSVEAKQMALIILNNGDNLEKAILSWCMQNHLALKNKRPDWIIFTYEQLVVNPEPIVNMLVKELKLTKRERIIKNLHHASKTTIQSDKITKGNIENLDYKRNDIIEKWREKVSNSQAEKLFNILDAFELNIYNLETSYPKSYLIN